MAMDSLTTKFSLGKSLKFPNNAKVFLFSSNPENHFEEILQCYWKESSASLNIDVTPTPHSLRVGLFDSGIGGLSIVQALQPLLPDGEIFYFADQANFPYGEKNALQLLECSRKAAHFLMEQGIQLLAIACHTASAHALASLQKELPIPVVGMIEPTLPLLKDPKRIALLGSRALIHSAIYQKRIEKENSPIMIPIDCQKLISLVEENRSEEARAVVQQLLQSQEFDALLLSCTHFSCIKNFLQEIVGSDILILDPTENMVKTIYKRFF